MIKMGMGQDNGRDAGRLHLEFLPVYLPECSASLEKTAVNQNSM